MTLQTNDIGQLFAVMYSSYGQRWTHTADAIPVWLEKLRNNAAPDIMRAASKAIDLYLEWPPSLPEFQALIRQTTPRLTSGNAGHGDATLAERVYAYTKPETRINPKGNPHGVHLQESIAQRRSGELARDYERRIGVAVTLALYPHLAATGYSDDYGG